MADIVITVGEIRYENTLNALFPRVLDRCRQLQNPNMLFKLFLELGEDAPPVMTGLIGYLPDSVKRELICQCVNGCHLTLTKALNEYLHSNEWGKSFLVQDISAVQEENRIKLVAHGVEAKEGKLMPFLKGVEQLAVMVLKKESVKSMLRELIQEALNKNGLMMELQSLDAVSGREKTARREEESFRLSPELEDAVVKALAGFIRNLSLKSDN